MKRCSKCKTDKPLTEFSTDNKRKDKLNVYCRQCKSDCGKQYRVKNPNVDALYYQANKQKIIKRAIAYEANKRKNDISFRILKNCRRRISHVLVDNYKSASTIELIGCPIDQLKSHIESQFTFGMSWANYGEWHIDHKNPCANFDLTNPEQQHKCFHFTNLQPLWAKDNLSKGKKQRYFAVIVN